MIVALGVAVLSGVFVGSGVTVFFGVLVTSGVAVLFCAHAEMIAMLKNTVRKKIKFLLLIVQVLLALNFICDPCLANLNGHNIIDL